MRPPTILVCINRNSSIHEAVLGNRTLCVNILTGQLERVARQFAGKTALPPAERFANQGWRTASSGLPVLSGALASLEGTIVDVKEVGSHSVLFVEINHIQVREDGESLTYFGRNFHRLGRVAAVALETSAS